MVGKHIHKYRRAKLGKSIIYKCILPGCTHFVQKPLVEGRVSICGRCGQPFVITKETLKKCPAMPHCDNCYKRPKEDKDIDSALDELLKEDI